MNLHLLRLAAVLALSFAWGAACGVLIPNTGTSMVVALLGGGLNGWFNAPYVFGKSDYPFQPAQR